MRDLFAAVIALVLLATAASLATALKGVPRAAASGARDSERAPRPFDHHGGPAEEDLVLVSEDEARFYYGDRSIDKDLIVAVRVLINGSPIAAYVVPASRGQAPASGDERSRIGRKGSRGIDGTSRLRRSPARRSSSAARFASACRRNWRGRCSTA